MALLSLALPSGDPNYRFCVILNLGAQIPACRGPKPHDKCLQRLKFLYDVRHKMLCLSGHKIMPVADDCQGPNSFFRRRFTYYNSVTYRIF